MINFYLSPLNESNNHCVVCFEEMKDGERIVAHPDMKNKKLIHDIHAICLSAWKEQDASCPCCRIKFDEIVSRPWGGWKNRAIEKIQLSLSPTTEATLCLSMTFLYSGLMVACHLFEGGANQLSDPRSLLTTAGVATLIFSLFLATSKPFA